MTVTDMTAYRAAVGKLEALANDLSARGFTTILVTDKGHPNVTVANKAVSRMTETIFAAPAQDGSWWLWWSWAERIAAIDDVDAAALKITHVLNFT